MHRPFRRPRRTARVGRTAVVAALLLTFLISGSPAALADNAGDGTTPLPGYTVSNPPLAPLTINGQSTRVLQGMQNHAAFMAELPALGTWNGDLIMWAHGYLGNSTVLQVSPPPAALRQLWLQQGYAWAASSYYANGYDVGAGVISTRSLSLAFSAVVEHPANRVFLVGNSMGGQVIARSLEEYPGAYAGALPICGVLGDNRLFDYFLDFNLAAQKLAGQVAYPFPTNYQSQTVPAMQGPLGLSGLQIAQNPTTAVGLQLQQLTVERSGGPRPGAAAAYGSFTAALFGFGVPDNGGALSANFFRVAQNVGTTYTPNTPVAINTTIQRVTAADPANRTGTALSQIPRVLGTPGVPVLSLQGLADLYVPFSMAQIYAGEVAANGQSNLLVQRAVREGVHCEFSGPEMTRAWNDLIGWVNSGVKPAGDDVTTRNTIAAANYGCQFTDPATYNDPAFISRRLLFAPCPSS